MKLLDYLKTMGTEDRVGFALACATTIGHMNNVAYGYKPCSETLALAVERESGGVVPVEETCPKADWAVVRGRPSTKARRGLITS